MRSMPTSVVLSNDTDKLHLEHRNFGPTPKAHVVEQTTSRSHKSGVKVTGTNHRNQDKREFLMRMGVVVCTGVIAVVAIVLFLSLQ